jgi:uncharacterized protein YegL
MEALMTDMENAKEGTIIEQTPFSGVEFATNPEPRCPCLLLLDVSGSMRGQPIAELNGGLRSFAHELQSDSLAIKRVELAIVKFGPVETVQEFQTAESFVPPTLVDEGDTPMGSAIVHGLSMLNSRKQRYRDNGVSFYRPWVFLITDGAPTDTWEAAASRIREGEASKAFAFFAIGVQDANMEILKKLCVREPLKLKGLQFRALFQWLSNSMKSVSRSMPGTDIPLENPTSPNGWASV